MSGCLQKKGQPGCEIQSSTPSVADANVELYAVLSALGEKTVLGKPEKTSGTIKEQLAAVAPALEKLCKQKEERLREFSDVQAQIQKICGEIVGKLNLNDQPPVVNESDLSLKKLQEYHAQLQELQKEKSERLHNVLEFVSTVHDLCSVLGMDFYNTVNEVHPSLNDSNGVQSKSISNETLSKLAETVIATSFVAIDDNTQKCLSFFRILLEPRGDLHKLAYKPSVFGGQSPFTLQERPFVEDLSCLC